MKLALPRGIVYHSLSQELSDLGKALTAKRDEHSIDAFESNFANYMETDYCVAFPYARMAIFHALTQSELPKGSEVIISPITIKPILDAIILAGFKPVILDLEKETLCIDPTQLKRKINKNTSAVIVTYLFGMVPDIENIVNISKEKNLFVIEDFSHNLNATYKGKRIGLYGDVGVYSASSIKTLDLHGSGLLVTSQEKLYEKLKKIQKQSQLPPKKVLAKKIITNFIRNFATNKWAFTFLTLPAIRLAALINPNKMMKHLGDRDKSPISNIPENWHYKFDPLQAIFGQRELKKIKTKDLIRIENAHYLKDQLSLYKEDFPLEREEAECVFWQFVIFEKDPFKMQKYFHRRALDCATTSLSLLSSLPYVECEDTPIANFVHTHAVFMPAYPSLNQSTLKFIADTLRSYREASK